MTVFVTGATGYIGTAVVQALQAEGHDVNGLARSPEAAAKLEAAGVEVVWGALTELSVLSRGARAADGVIHLGATGNAGPGRGGYGRRGRHAERGGGDGKAVRLHQRHLGAGEHGGPGGGRGRAR